MCALGILSILSTRGCLAQVSFRGCPPFPLAPDRTHRLIQLQGALSFNQMLHQKKTGIQVMYCSIQLQAELVCIISCYFWTKTNCLCVFWVTDANRVLLWVWINIAAQPSAALLSSWVPIYSLDEAVVSEGSFTTRGDWMPLQLVD